MISFLKILLIAVLAFMIYEIIITSLESNLFLELPALIQIPWMRATLFDFYANVLCLFIWIGWKEKVLWKKILWLLFMVTMGSVATCIYLLKTLFALKPGEPLSTVFTKRNN